MLALVNGLIRLTMKWQLGLHIDIPRLRSKLAAQNRLAPPLPTDIRRERVDCDGVGAEWLIPATAHPDRVILYFHGGAFVARTPDMHAAMLSAWCRALNARVLMVDYRLAPEHPYPAALEDCCKSYRWLLGQGISSRRIVIGGDSAGGNLALAALQHASTQGTPTPACAVLLSPFLDLTLSGASILVNARHDPVFTPAFGLGIRKFYADGARLSESGVSPLFGSFQDLPPLLFQVGSTEMLLDDALRAAHLAHSAGVQTHLEIWHRLPHVFQSIAILPHARVAISHIVRFISSHTGWDFEVNDQ